jgi:hypothetical protein
MLSLEVCEVPDDLILRFLDEAGGELTHDHPHNVLEAFQTVEQEFGIKQGEWVRENSN